MRKLKKIRNLLRNLQESEVFGLSRISVVGFQKSGRDKEEKNMEEKQT